MLPPVLSVRQAADLLNLSPDSVRRMLKDGRLQGMKIGSRWFVTQQALERWLANHVVGDAELRQNNELLMAIVQSAPIAITMFDMDGIVRLWNASAERVFGWRAEEVIGRFMPTVPEGRRDEFLHNLRMMFDGDVIIGRETQRQRKGGTPIDVQLWGVPLRDSQGNMRFLSMVSDITERKRVEQQKQLLQELTESLAEALTSQQMIRVVVEHGVGRLGAYWGYLGMLNAEGTVLTGMWYPDIGDHITSRFRHIPLETPVPLTDAVREQTPIWIRDLEAYQQRYPHLASTIQGSTGTQALFAVPLWVGDRIIGALGASFSQPQVFDEADQSFLLTLSRLCAQALERARLYEVEQAQRREAEKTAERLSRLQRVTAALAGTLTVEQVGKVVVDQVTDVLGAASGTFQLLVDEGKTFEIIYRTGSLMSENELASWRRYPAHPGFVATDAVLKCQPMWFENGQQVAEKYPALAELTKKYSGASVQLPLAINGEGIGLITITFAEPRKFTLDERAFMLVLSQYCAQALERARLYESEREARLKAEEADRLKLQFLAMISHELRTPLTSIKGFSSTLLSKDVQWTDEDRDGFLRVIDEDADRLTELIEQLLDLSRLQAGTLSIQPKPVTMQDMLHELEPQLNLLTPKHRFEMEVEEALPPLVADPVRVSQVITNMVENSAKYSPPGSLIYLKAHRMEDCVQVDVIDQGEGIPHDQRDRVFEAFRQVERRNGLRPGAGLGLAICKGLVEAHGGHIWIQDSPPPGTTISFRLPLNEPV